MAPPSVAPAWSSTHPVSEPFPLTAKWNQMIDPPGVQRLPVDAPPLARLTVDRLPALMR